ncbi:MAG: hypothetical protein ACHQRM_11075 [Bacteroidia bacterium]
MELLLTVFYSLIFIFLIFRMKFFRLERFSPVLVSAAFLLKVIAGIMLWWVYTYYYTDRSTADIYKYFDDSKIMFDTLRKSPSDFVHMLFDFRNNTPHFDGYYAQMHNWARQYESNLYNDSHTIIRFNTVLRFFSFGYYQVHSVFLCFLSLSGLVGLYRVFSPYLPGKEKLCFLLIFLMPSVLFWGSGVLKEGILFFGLGLLLYHWKKTWFGHLNLTSILWIIFTLLLILATKFYVLVSLLPGLLYTAWIGFAGSGRALLKFVIVLMVFSGIGIGVKYGIPAYDPLQVLAIKQRDFNCLAQGGILLRSDTAIVFLSLEQKEKSLVDTDPHLSTKDKIYTINTGTRYAWWHDYYATEDTSFAVQTGPSDRYRVENDMPRSGSLISIRPLEPTITSFLRNAPMALVNSLFRPFLNEAKGPLLLLSALETVAYSVFMILCIIYRKRSEIQWEWIWFCISFAGILFIITGLTTPILGALVRYKVPGVPFLLLAFLFLLDTERLYKSFPFLKKALE